MSQQPWDDLADAFEALAHAERFGSAADKVAAHGEVLRAKEHLGGIGSLLILMALEHGGFAVQRKLFETVADANSETYKASVRAIKLVKSLVAEVDALRQDVKQLREQLARLTPGVGEPGKTL